MHPLARPNDPKLVVCLLVTCRCPRLAKLDQPTGVRFETGTKGRSAPPANVRFYPKSGHSVR